MRHSQLAISDSVIELPEAAMASYVFHVAIAFLALSCALVLTQEPVRIDRCSVINFDFNQPSAGVGNVQEVPVAEKPKSQPPVVVHTVKRLPRPHPVPVATPPINKTITTMPVEISPVPSAPAPLIDIPLPVFNNDPPPLAEVHIGRAAAPETEVEGHHPLYWKLSGGVELVPVVPARTEQDQHVVCGGAGGGSCIVEVDWRPYMADVQRRIKKHWFPPKHCFDPSPITVVQFKIDRYGKVSDLKLVRAKGHQWDEKAALEAVKQAGELGFRPLPAGAPDSVDIEFTFDINLFQQLYRYPTSGKPGDSSRVLNSAKSNQAD